MNCRWSSGNPRTMNEKWSRDVLMNTSSPQLANVTMVALKSDMKVIFNAPLLSIHFHFHHPSTERIRRNNWPVRIELVRLWIIFLRIVQRVCGHTDQHPLLHVDAVVRYVLAAFAFQPESKRSTHSNLSTGREKGEQANLTAGEYMRRTSLMTWSKYGKSKIISWPTSPCQEAKQSALVLGVGTSCGSTITNCSSRSTICSYNLSWTWGFLART